MKKYDQMKIRSDLSCGVKQAGDLIEQACHLVRGLGGRPIVRYRARRGIIGFTSVHQAPTINIQSDPIDQIPISVVCCPVGCRSFRSLRTGTSASRRRTALRSSSKEQGMWGGAGRR